MAGTTAAASGAIAGAVFVLGRRAVFDLPTAVTAVVGLALLWRFRVPEPLLVVAAGLSGPRSLATIPRVATGPGGVLRDLTGLDRSRRDGG